MHRRKDPCRFAVIEMPHSCVVRFVKDLTEPRQSHSIQTTDIAKFSTLTVSSGLFMVVSSYARSLNTLVALRHRLELHNGRDGRVAIWNARHAPYSIQDGFFWVIISPKSQKVSAFSLAHGRPQVQSFDQ